MHTTTLHAPPPQPCSLVRGREHAQRQHAHPCNGHQDAVRADGGGAVLHAAAGGVAGPGEEGGGQQCHTRISAALRVCF